MSEPAAKIKKSRSNYGERYRLDQCGRLLKLSGCLTCRRSRVKCDEAIPTCKRCQRLDLRCEQPSFQITLGERRRGLGPLKSRTPESWSPSSILPDLPPSSIIGSPPANVLGSEQTMELYDGMDENWSTTYPSSGTDYSNSLTSLQPLNMTGIMRLNDEWLLPYPQSTEIPFTGVEHQLKSLSLAPCIPAEAITIRGVPLTDIEKRALVYFRTSFSLSQTTRDPEFSTTTLLLQLNTKSSPMLLHLILAVSLYDLQTRGEAHDHAENMAQRHYEDGAAELAQALQSEQPADHIAVLSSLYCVYAYMSRQVSVSSHKLNRLSFTAIDYIKRTGLDVLFLVPNLSSAASQTPSMEKTKAENSLIARLIMWIFKINAQCCFLGCTPSVLGYFEARPELLDAIYATSRLALQLNWGKSYPISQSIRDIESNLSIDFMLELLVMPYKISQCSHISGSSNTDSDIFAKLRNTMDRMEVVRYSCSFFWLMMAGAVFYYGSSEMTLQPAMKLKCATSATMFYATKLYLLRCGPNPFGTQDCPEAAHALGQLLLFAKHVCISGAPQPVYEFQRSLFIACLETGDTIHQEWLTSKIFDPRFQGVLEKVFQMKRRAGGEIGIDSIKGLLARRT